MKLENVWYLYLVGGWTNPFEKYARQIGPFPQNRGDNKKIFETTNLLCIPFEKTHFMQVQIKWFEILVVNLNEIWTAWI